MDSGHTERRKSESAGMASVPNHLFAYLYKTTDRDSARGRTAAELD
jgi:hypothetical protein